MPSAQTSPASARPRRGDAHRRRGLCQRDHRRCPLTRAVAAAAPRFATCASAHVAPSLPCPAPTRPRVPSTGARRRRRCAEPRCPRKGALRAIAPVQPRASHQRRPCKRECRPPAHVAAAAAPRHRTRASARAPPSPPCARRVGGNTAETGLAQTADPAAAADSAKATASLRQSIPRKPQPRRRRLAPNGVQDTILSHDNQPDNEKNRADAKRCSAKRRSSKRHSVRSVRPSHPASLYLAVRNCKTFFHILPLLAKQVLPEAQMASSALIFVENATKMGIIM